MQKQLMQITDRSSQRDFLSISSASRIGKTVVVLVKQLNYPGITSEQEKTNLTLPVRAWVSSDCLTEGFCLGFERIQRIWSTSFRMEHQLPADIANVPPADTKPPPLRPANLVKVEERKFLGKPW